MLPYLQLLLGWPVITLTIAGATLYLFKDAVRGFINRLNIAEGYGWRIEAINPQFQLEEAKELSPPQQNVPAAVDQQQLIQQYQEVYFWFWCERIYNIIFGTQILVLEFLETRPDGERYAALELFYQESVRRNRLPRLMSDYLDFLRNVGLIEYFSKENDLYTRITPLGVNFLRYIREQYPSGYQLRLG